MASKIDISNQALIMLGAAPIVSFDDGTVEANALNTVYEPAKSQVLRSYPWRCATKAATLALLSETPVNPLYDWQFSWPDDAIRILDVRMPGNQVGRKIRWETEGRNILCDVDTAMASYVFDIDEPQLDAHVEMALAAKLALDLCYTLTASNTREGTLYNLFEQKLNEARTTDRQEASHKVFGIDQLQVVRR